MVDLHLSSFPVRRCSRVRGTPCTSDPAMIATLSEAPDNQTKTMQGFLRPAARAAFAESIVAGAPYVGTFTTPGAESF
jgi:hypothetical protein